MFVCISTSLSCFVIVNLMELIFAGNSRENQSHYSLSSSSFFAHAVVICPCLFCYRLLFMSICPCFCIRLLFLSRTSYLDFGLGLIYITTEQETPLIPIYCVIRADG